MKRFKTTMVITTIILVILFLNAEAQVTNGLHFTRGGKNFWYGADTSVTGAPAPGFESLTNVPIDHPNVACNSCHGPTDANGIAYSTSNPYPGPGCVDCHPLPNYTPLSENQCLGCHSRQKAEATTLGGTGYPDVHRNASTPLKCWDCHVNSTENFNDMHGDGTIYKSQLEPGAIKADCQNSGCHTQLPGSHSSHDPHGGALHCSACHTRTVIACYNCHFESQVLHGIKRAKQQIHDYVILVNRAKDGKIGTATFQSLSYQGNTWVAFAPYSAHTITKNNARVCTDCHVNYGGSVAAIQQYNSTGHIQFATWNSNDSTLSWLHGVVPLPADYQRSFKMDFITFNGDPSSPPTASKNWSFVEGDWDGHQLFFATPLTKVQMAKIGFDTTLTAIDDKPTGMLPAVFGLQQNYPNPFNPATTISFLLPRSMSVSLVVYDIHGKKVQTLLDNQNLTPGNHSYNFYSEGLASGIYLYSLITDDFTQTRKMFLMK